MPAPTFVSSLSPLRLARTALAVAALSASTGLTVHAEPAGPFAALAGSWLGTGTIKKNDGSSEAIRCRATYRVSDAGYGVAQILQCSAAHSQFDTSSKVRLSDGALSGTFSETIHNVTESVSGRVEGAKLIQAKVAGTYFSAGLSIVTSGASQSVGIWPAGQTDVAAVTMSLRRSPSVYASDVAGAL